MKSLINAILTLVFFLFTGILLVGCATPHDVEIVQSDNEAATAFEGEQTEQVKVKAEQIAEVLNFECPSGQENSYLCGAAKAYSGAMAARDIASIEGREYKRERAKTGVDAQINFTDKAAGGIPIAGMTIVSGRAINKDKGTVKNESGTMNYTYDEDHATSVSMDEGVAASTNSPQRDTTTTENVIQP